MNTRRTAPVDPAELLHFRDMLVEWVTARGGTVPHRGYATKTQNTDLLIICPDGTELELEFRPTGLTAPRCWVCRCRYPHGLDRPDSGPLTCPGAERTVR